MLDLYPQYAVSSAPAVFLISFTFVNDKISIFAFEGR